MKTFVVTSVAMEVRSSDGAVTRAIGAQRMVEADYYRVVDGALIFRTEKRGNEQYNPAVRMFAPGYWAEVHEHKTLQERVHEHRQRVHGEREVDLAPAAIDIPDFLRVA